MGVRLHLVGANAEFLLLDSLWSQGWLSSLSSGCEPSCALALQADQDLALCPCKEHSRAATLGFYKVRGSPSAPDHMEVPYGNMCQARVLLVSQFESDICARQGTALYVHVARCCSRGKGDAPNPQSGAILLLLEVGVLLCSACLRPEQLLAQHGAQPSRVVWYPEVPVLFLVAFAITLQLPGYPAGVCVCVCVNFSS